MPRQRKIEYIEVEKTEAVIHKRGDIWYMRVRLPDTSEYLKKSCGTRDQEIAAGKCRAKYWKFLQRKEDGIPVTKRTFAMLAEEVLADLRERAKVQELSPDMLTLHTSKIRTVVKYWGDKFASDVTETSWKAYVRHRKLTGRARYEGDVLSPTTLRHEKAAMREVLKYARDQKLILFIPDMPTPSQAEGDGVRPPFTTEEIKRILDHLEQAINEAVARGDTSKLMARVQLFFYVALAADLGLRTNDFKLLRWRDISSKTILRKTGKIDEVILIKCRGKIKMQHRKDRSYRLSVGRPSAAQWLRKLSEWYPDHKQEDLVFPAEKAGRARKMDRLLKRVLRRLGIEKYAEGLVRTTYSLRHSHAMERLTSKKITPEDLALNMGCKMRMLEKHYGSHYKILDKLDELSA